MFIFETVPVFFQDFDQDGKVSKDDFTTAVVKDDMLLEALGFCLPQHQV